MSELQYRNKRNAAAWRVRMWEHAQGRFKAVAANRVG